jgi:hypothetical protein
MGPDWKKGADDSKYSISLDNASINSPYTQSNYSLHGPPVNARISNMSNDLNQKCLRKTLSNPSRRSSQMSNRKAQSWTSILTKLKPNQNEKVFFKQRLIRQSTETVCKFKDCLR